MSEETTVHIGRLRVGSKFRMPMTLGPDMYGTLDEKYSGSAVVSYVSPFRKTQSCALSAPVIQIDKFPVIASPVEEKNGDSTASPVARLTNVRYEVTALSGLIITAKTAHGVVYRALKRIGSASLEAIIQAAHEDGYEPKGDAAYHVRRKLGDLENDGFVRRKETS